MADFQKQIEDYRRQQQRKQPTGNFKLRFRKLLMLGVGGSSEKCSTAIDVEPPAPSKDIPILQRESVESPIPTSSEEDFELQETNTVKNEDKRLKYILWALYFLFWVTLYIIAIELKFGLVFLMFSALFAIYFNTRTGPKKRNEISAYSVFNKNCESIDGTLKAEQFEREIRFGPGSVH